LLPLIDPVPEKAVDPAREIIQRMLVRFEAHWLANMRAKIGLRSEQTADRALVEDLLETMHRGSADFTLTFRRLCDAAGPDSDSAAVRNGFSDPAAYDAWAVRWKTRLAEEETTATEQAEWMRRSNPARIPRNHRIEEAIRAAVTGDDFGPFERLGAALGEPYSAQEVFREFEAPPTESQRVRRTFCGT
jgi:uncharacterized protein YdiU (UPF0061 family)